MLESDALKAQINQILEDSRPSKHTWDEAVARKEAAEHKTDEILAAADKLRDEIKAARDEIQARKAALARRRSDLASVSAGLAERRAKQLKDVEKSTQMLRFRWSQTAEDTASTRTFLCTEAVRLYGLKRVAKKGITGRYEYSLGRIPIVDLTSMDCESPPCFPSLPLLSDSSLSLPFPSLPCPCLYKKVGNRRVIYSMEDEQKKSKEKRELCTRWKVKREARRKESYILEQEEKKEKRELYTWRKNRREERERERAIYLKRGQERKGKRRAIYWRR